jgi:hypothetical protein
MRTAFYHPSALPPRDWLFFAALLWERIHVSDLVGSALRDHPEYVAATPDAAMLLRLISETSICTSAPPLLAQDLPSDQEQAWTAYLSGANQPLAAFLSQEELPPERRTILSAEQLVALATLMDQVVLHDRFTAVFPSVDFFFADNHAFITSAHSRQHLLLQGVEAPIPRVPNHVSIAQLEAFRAETALQRQRCRDAMATELARFETIGTEQDFVAAVRQVGDVLREQLELLEARCRQHKVNVMKKAFGVTLAAPAALQVIASALAVPLFQPAAIVSVLSLAAADYLAARERHQAELRSAPWAYLMSLKRLR